MKKLLAVFGLAGLLFGLAADARANTSSYDPNTGIVTVVNDEGGAGASYEIESSTVPANNGDTLSFQWRSEDVACGGGVPRVFLQGGAYNSFDGNPGACGTDPDADGWRTVTATISGITDGTAGHIGLVNDNPSDLGTVQFRNVTVNGVSLLPSMAPQNKEQCKNGGWQNGAYRNQGECVSSFAKK